MGSMDLEFLISENYLAFLMLGGLLIIMYAFRKVHLPASRTFLLVALVLFAMCIASSLERWAVQSPDRYEVRVVASVVHYVLQPLVIYLELIVLLPPLCEKRRRALLVLPLVINAVIYLMAPFSGHLVFWYESDYTFHRGPLGSSVYVVTFIYLALLIYKSVRVLSEKDKRFSTILLYVAGIAILTATLEALNIAPGYIDEAFVLGAFLFYTYLITIYEQHIKTELVSKELELSRNELSLLRQQINPHFVFNSLHIIKSLIRSNPDKAVKSLEDFSDYLRASIDILRSDELVSFDDELDNIEAYVSLALADESKDVHVEYEINERYFRLPPLSVEPLVENAIIHGISGSGTVRISTTSDDASYIVMVSDDGVGFNIEGTEQAKERRGIGIENVRARIQKQCNGTMDIKSGADGTDVIIRIPKEQEDQI